MDILAVQRALKLQGFDPGPLDGIWGRLTAAAVKAFQRRVGLPIGLVTPDAERSILAGSPPAQQQTGLVWFDEAVRLLGITEKPGSGSNPTILDWAKDLDLAYSGDDIPWCGLFVGHCIASTLPDEPLPNNPLGARNWLKLGRSTQPVLGAVLVFWRGSRDGWLGHVGFYAGEDADAFKLLGGNQSDRVGYARIAKNRLLGARWPRSAVGVGFGPISGGVDGVPSGGSED
jgi:uncharacterized protein (TIGR02594 family)